MESPFLHSNVYFFETTMEEVKILLQNYKTIPSVMELNNITLFLLLLGSEHTALPKDTTHEN